MKHHIPRERVWHWIHQMRQAGLPAFAHEATELITNPPTEDEHEVAEAWARWKCGGPEPSETDQIARRALSETLVVAWLHAAVEVMEEKGEGRKPN